MGAQLSTVIATWGARWCARCVRGVWSGYRAPARRRCRVHRCCWRRRLRLRWVRQRSEGQVRWWRSRRSL